MDQPSHLDVAFETIPGCYITLLCWALLLLVNGRNHKIRISEGALVMFSAKHVENENTDSVKKAALWFLCFFLTSG